jgi:hypothetical protein
MNNVDYVQYKILYTLYLVIPVKSYISWLTITAVNQQYSTILFLFLFLFSTPFSKNFQF